MASEHKSDPIRSKIKIDKVGIRSQASDACPSNASARRPDQRLQYNINGNIKKAIVGKRIFY